MIAPKRFNGLITLMVVLATTLLVCLGFWQLSRSHEKEAQFAAIEMKTALAPASSKELLQNNDVQKMLYHPVSLRGKFDNRHVILLDNKIYKGQPGYHVITPIALDDQTVILINRGWIPLGKSRATLPSLDPVIGEVTIEGSLDFSYRNLLISSALESNTIKWPLRMQQLDLALLNSVLGKTIYPMLVNLSSNSPYAFIMIPKKEQTLGPERHRLYAMQWFSLAVTLLSLFCFYCFRK